MSSDTGSDRHLGLWGATSVGVGAIVGGGILALAGASFAAAGPSALAAFALNGVIALLTALSFAEVSSKFPQSGGTYTFARKVLSIEAAFGVGWVVWFASIVAAVLYALGFGQFAATATSDLCTALAGESPEWLTARAAVAAWASAATLFYALALARKSAGGGAWLNAGKIAVFAILIVGGLWAMRHRSPAELGASLRPFMAGGFGGLLQAMGFTFITLQGFDLIASVAGEVRHPERTVPRAMLGSLGIGMGVYLPLLLVIATVGLAPGQSVTEASRRHADTFVAVAAGNYLGPFGYWLVLAAGILSMASALGAYMFAASRVAMSMARDHTLPRVLARVHPQLHTPRAAIAATALIVLVVLLIMSDVAAAGTAASLIFLITFALAHGIALLVRRRSRRRPPPFRTPLFPAVPVVGGLACLALAVYQGIAVPTAGLIAAAWLACGGLLFLGLFAQRARIADASTAAADPELVALRGRNPLVLVPIANPANAGGLVALANALAPPEVGRVLLLSVVVAPKGWRPRGDQGPFERTQQVLGEALAASIEAGTSPEALTTVARQPWAEIRRVAREHRCDSLLLGLSQLSETTVSGPLDRLVSTVDCDVVVLRAPTGWQPGEVRRILVPTAGRGGHERLLARLLASLSRAHFREDRQVTFLNAIPSGADDSRRRIAERDVARVARNLAIPRSEVVVAAGESPIDTVASHADSSDLVILGVQRAAGKKLFGSFALQVARKTACPLLLISCRD